MDVTRAFIFRAANLADPASESRVRRVTTQRDGEQSMALQAPQFHGSGTMKKPRRPGLSPMDVGDRQHAFLCEDRSRGQRDCRNARIVPFLPVGRAYGPRVTGSCIPM
jgi:hypothetical protein